MTVNLYRRFFSASFSDIFRIYQYLCIICTTDYILSFTCKLHISNIYFLCCVRYVFYMLKIVYRWGITSAILFIRLFYEKIKEKNIIYSSCGITMWPWLQYKKKYNLKFQSIKPIFGGSNMLSQRRNSKLGQINYMDVVVAGWSLLLA